MNISHKPQTSWKQLANRVFHTLTVLIVIELSTFDNDRKWKDTSLGFPSLDSMKFLKSLLFPVTWVLYITFSGK